MQHGVMPMAGPLLIGYDALKTYTRFWNGAIDDVRIWKRALSPQEIQASIDTAPSAGEQDLLAWWNFDETVQGERDVPLFEEPITALRSASDGSLWIGTAKGVTLLPSGVEGRMNSQSFAASDGLAAGPVISIFEAADGTMWFGTTSGGVSRMSRDGSMLSAANSQPATNSRFTTFTMADGLSNNTILAIAQDSEGAMWFAGGMMNARDIAGLSRYDGKSFANFSRADGLVGESVQALHIDQEGGVWATTNSGVSHYDSLSVTVFGEADGLDAGVIWDILSTSDGNVWIRAGSSEGKLSRFDGRSW
jgi:ligand-binding sensor domain-containing protein